MLRSISQNLLHIYVLRTTEASFLHSWLNSIVRGEKSSIIFGMSLDTADHSHLRIKSRPAGETVYVLEQCDVLLLGHVDNLTAVSSPRPICPMASLVDLFPACRDVGPRGQHSAHNTVSLLGIRKGKKGNQNLHTHCQAWQIPSTDIVEDKKREKTIEARPHVAGRVPRRPPSPAHLRPADPEGRGSFLPLSLWLARAELSRESRQLRSVQASGRWAKF